MDDFQLYYPALKKQIICFPLVSLALMWIGVLYYRMGCDLEMSLLMPVAAASAMYYVAPIGIARRDFKPISALLPVTASEKMTFLLLYFGLFIAVEINLSIIISALIVLPPIPNGLSTLWDIMTGFGKHYPPVFLVISWGPALAILLCVLYTVVTVKRNRVFKGLLAFVVALILLMLVGGIIGFIVGMLEGYGYLPDLGLWNNYAKTLTPRFTYILMVVEFVFSLPIVATYLVLLYKKLQRSGF